MVKPQKVTLRTVTDAWRTRTPFDCNGTLTGNTDTYGTGRLPDSWREKFNTESDHIVFVVRSYATPIAWVMRDGEVVMPPVKYSVTTSKHQGRLY